LTAIKATTLEIRDLHKSYRLAGGRTVPAVRGFSLSVRPGEFVTLLGPSGCGKTTVLRTLAGLEEADSGDVLLDGKSILRLPAYRRRVGMVFQNYALFPHLSVFENVAYSFRVRRAPDTEVRPAVTEALQAVGLETMASRMPGQLSGGQQQRVALARAIVMRPDLLLFDEPLSNLDAKLRLQVRVELRRLQKQLGTTAIYVTHDQEEAMSLSDRVAVMRDGLLEQVGTPEEIYARPCSHFVADFVGRVNALFARVVERRMGGSLVEMLGQRVELDVEFDRGEALMLLLRPESIRLDAAAPGRTGGSIEELEYRGDRVEYRVRVGETLVVVTEPPRVRDQRLVEGSSVGLSWEPGAVHVLPAQDGGTSMVSAPHVPPRAGRA
jgi:iron(III) transport system ATP-binding protein